jgi:hypothetical protein
MIDLDELLEVDGPVILVDVPDLEFLWPDNLPERRSQCTETVPPCWGDISCWRMSWRGRRPCPETPPIIDNVTEVFMFTAALSQVVVLSNPPTCVVVG